MLTSWISAHEGIILLHNARPHTAPLNVKQSINWAWETVPHPPYSSHLTLFDFHLLGLLKEALDGMKFYENDKVKKFS